MNLIASSLFDILLNVFSIRFMFVKYSLQTKITTVMKRNSFTTSFIMLGVAYFVINMGFHVHHAMDKTGKARSVPQF